MVCLNEADHDRAALCRLRHIGDAMRDYASLLPVALELDLYNAGWNGRITPYPGQDVRQFAMSSLARSLVKKFSDVKDATADAKALKLFLEINERCRTFSLGASRVTEAETIAIGEAKDYIYRFFYPEDQTGLENLVLSFSSVADGFGLGNGANIGSYGTDFLSKIGTSTMAATDPVLHKLYMQAICEHRVWSDVESIRSVNRGYQLVQGSRLSFVPKTRDISRTICTEPICNMLFQKGIASVLERRLFETSGISLERQPEKNRKLAQLGSITGEFSTIDLSSASDSMSLSLVREFFPRHVTSWLEMTRSPLTILPDGTKVELHMVSSMGNAFTFPLQTLFFASLVYGAYRILGIPVERPTRHSLGNFAVFGDDIIVDVRADRLVRKLLDICGFSVNVEKSFNEGDFRESCGRDFLRGQNVRGVYIKTLKDDCDRYSAINRLNYWSAEHCIPLPHTISCLLRGLRRFDVPFDEMDIAGVKVPLSAKKKITLEPNTGGVNYRFVKVREWSTSVLDIDVRPPKLKGWIKNPSAVLLAALAGTLRKGRVVPRASRRSVSIRRGHSSRWDYIPSDQDLYPGFGEVWKHFVEVNLNFLQVSQPGLK